MAYADAGSVAARAGRLSAAWDDLSTPSMADIDVFCGEVGSEIDALLTGRGLTPPDAGTVAAGALAGLNADGALVLAVEATFPAGIPGDVKQLLDTVAARYRDGMTALMDGKHAAIKALEADGGSPAATSFWQEEPSYGQYVTPDQLAAENPYLAPDFARGQAL